MSDFENYPYNEQHELNLDPTLKDLKEDKTTAENANKRIDGVEDTINNDNKKLDDANAKADAINQNADNFVDQSNTRINDIENNADNSVNDINKKAEDISDKADDLNEKIADNADKVDDINNKQNETKEQVDDSVSNAYYENELTPEEMKSAKKMGVLKVAKASGITSNEISTVTPSGALGNCVVWSSSPFTFINTNPQILTDQDLSGENKIVQYQCAGSFFEYASSDNVSDGFAFGSNGHIIGGYSSISNDFLVTNKHLDILGGYVGPRTIILPKTDNHTWDGNYEQFINIGSNRIITTKQTPFSNHIYAYYVYSVGYDGMKLAGYVYNGTLTQARIDSSNPTSFKVEYSDSSLTFKTLVTYTESQTYRVYFVDLGEM